MESSFSERDGRALHELLQDVSGDSLVRIDRKGFLTHASHNFAAYWPDLTDLLVLPHVSDLARHCHRDAVRSYVQSALTGSDPRRPLEFPVAQCETANQSDASWCALSVRRIENDQAHGGCAIGLLRPLTQRKTTGDGGETRGVDPVSGLHDRGAFTRKVRGWLGNGDSAKLVVFSIDRMAALRLQYGESAADEIMWGFARFMESMSRAEFEIGQMDRERVGVMVPGASVRDAQEWAREAIETFSALALRSGPGKLRLAASAGLAPLQISVDHSMLQAEIGLVMARAAGGGQVRMCDHPLMSMRA